MADAIKEVVKETTEAVKETLVGPSDDVSPGSKQTVALFEEHALKDEASGEAYMSEKEFVNAIAPESGDYVSPDQSPSPFPWALRQQWY